MPALVDLSASQLLARRTLFVGAASPEAAFKQLAKKWHPDVNKSPEAEKVFTHITLQYRQFKNGGEYPDTLTIKTSKGASHYPYLAKRTFELGEIYICERHLIWATRREYDDLAKRWLETVKGYKFPNDDVKNKITPFIPRNSHTVGNGDRAYTICDRPADLIRVADIIAAKGPMNPRHVAWMMTRAYNLAGFLSYANIQHLDISPETFFIEPATHHGALLGGWFYSAPDKLSPLAAPARTSHLAKQKLNLDAQIRLMGRRALGVTSHAQLLTRKDVAAPMKDWLTNMPNGSISAAQVAWKDALKASFGGISFTEYALTTREVYPQP